MTRYLLDTNICIYIIKRKSEVVLEKLHRAFHSSVAISSITLSELEYGVQKSEFAERNAISLLRFLAVIDILPYNGSAAREYGKIRASLERTGNVIGNMDMLIAAHAKSLGAILVTNNEKEFKRVNGIRIENWATG
jgi:tRNA(fMet)-specific endonuclease VapC